MKYIITILSVLWIANSHAQNINWNSLNADQQAVTYLNFGYDYGIVTQIGFGQKVLANKSLLLNADYSFPMGKNIVDDFKVRLGGQMPVYSKHSFALSLKVYSVFRRHQTSLVRMASFGSETSALIGFYKPKWHIAAELGFDKSITTNLKHTEEMRKSYPTISDGWFIPSGGHFFYGIQASRAIKEHLQISLQVGATNAQFDDVEALLPYYLQVGVLYKI